jgi:hypothetical protein
VEGRGGVTAPGKPGLGTPGMWSAPRTPNAPYDAPDGTVVATSPVSMSCGYVVASSLRLCRRRSVSAFAPRPPSAAGDRREWISIRDSRELAELGFVAKRSRAGPRWARQRVHCTASPCRHRTFPAKCCVERRVPGRPFGDSSDIVRGDRVAMRDHSTRYAFRRYLESLVWQGLWGSSRDGNVAAGFWSDPASAGQFGLRIRGDGSSLPLTSLRRERETAGGAGVSN